MASQVPQDAYNPADAKEFRQQKEYFFRRNRHAPIRGQAVDQIRYYPITEAYVFKAKLELSHDEKRVWLATSHGDSEAYLKFAVAYFEVEDGVQRLSLFLPEGAPDSERLFVPFTDLSNETETYEGGRYLEVPREDIQIQQCRLDFNFAYNPYCAYAEHFRCPIPPAENRLSFAVRAGEMRYERT